MSYAADPSPWALGLLALVWAASESREWVASRVESWRSDDPEDGRDALETLHHRFETTDMDVAEFERRLEDLLEPCDDEMRRRLEDVEDVGETTAAEVAVAFDSVEHVRQAGRDELTDVPHVGPERAAAIREDFE